MHPVSVPRWGLLDSPRKMWNFQETSGVRPWSMISIGEEKKPKGDDTKIQQGELKNKLRWLKNIYIRLTEKHRSGWITFKCQKSSWNISLAIKESLRTENRTQYRNHQIINACKNQIYRKKSRYISLDWLHNTTVSLPPRLISPLSYNMRNE